MVVGLVLGAVLLPAVRNRDSFPLSTYPMYARQRDVIAIVPAAIGVDATGVRRRLSMATIARTDDPLIAAASLRNAIGSGTAEALCAEIATRAPAGIVVVEIVEERVELVKAATSTDASLDPAGPERTVHASCEVPP